MLVGRANSQLQECFDTERCRQILPIHPQSPYPSSFEPKLEAELRRHGQRERHGRLRIWSNQASYFVLSHHDAKPLFPMGHDLVLTFVSSSRDVWQVNHDRLAPFSLAAQSVDASCALFDCAWVPGKVMVDHVSTEPLEIDALTHNLAANQNVGEKRRVECAHQASPSVPARLTCGNLNVGKGRSRPDGAVLVFVFFDPNGACTDPANRFQVQPSLVGRTLRVFVYRGDSTSADVGAEFFRNSHAEAY